MLRRWRADRQQSAIIVSPKLTLEHSVTVYMQYEVSIDIVQKVVAEFMCLHMTAMTAVRDTRPCPYHTAVYCS